MRTIVSVMLLGGGLLLGWMMASLYIAACSPQIVIQPRSNRWPSVVAEATPPRGCFVVLAYDSEQDVSDLVRCLSLLRDAVPAGLLDRHPVLVFHDAGAFAYGSESRTRLVKEIPGAWFLEADLTMPFAEESDGEWANTKRGRWSYSKMIRFFARQLARMPVMHQFDYYLRLDTDSQILSPIDYDPFEVMRSRDLVYGYRSMTHDNAVVTRNFSATVQAFIDQQPQGWTPTFYSRERHAAPDGSVPIFYNNLEVVDLAFQRRTDVQAFTDFVDRGIFLHRWGDAGIRFAQMALFAKPHQIHCFCDIHYDHAGIRVRADPACRNHSRHYYSGALPAYLTRQLAPLAPSNAHERGAALLFGTF